MVRSLVLCFDVDCDPGLEFHGEVVGEDGDLITVNLVYAGCTAKVNLNQSELREIEDYYDRCAAEGSNEHQIEESQKAVAHLDVILGDPQRLRTVAEDFI